MTIPPSNHARLALVLAAAYTVAGSLAFAQHSTGHAGAATGVAAPSAGAHAAPGGHAVPGGGPHQHLDGRFGHDHYYYNPGYSVRRPPGAPEQEVHGRDGYRYRFDRGNWYRWNGRSWLIWTAPFGLYVPFLPPFYTTVWWYGVPYYYANDTYYQWDGGMQEYEVVPPPDGIEANGVTQPPASDQLFAYPNNGQSDAQQAQDRDACRHWATAQTGYDPSVPGGGVAADQTVQKRNDYFRAQVSCLEGRGYTVR
jgi:hypothetical protein